MRKIAVAPVTSQGYRAPRMSDDYVIPDGANIGHVHLKVSDIERSLAFWRDVIGFRVTARWRDEAAFLSAGGYHHHLGLNTWTSRGGPPPSPRNTGLYHVAVRYPDRPSLAVGLRRVLTAGIPLVGAADHGVSHSIYLTDPDQNGVELTVDLPREQWQHDAQGQIVMVTEPLDLDALLAEAGLA